MLSKLLREIFFSVALQGFAQSFNFQDFLFFFFFLDFLWSKYISLYEHWTLEKTEFLYYGANINSIIAQIYLLLQIMLMHCVSVYILWKFVVRSFSSPFVESERLESHWILFSCNTKYKAIINIGVEAHIVRYS